MGRKKEYGTPAQALRPAGGIGLVQINTGRTVHHEFAKTLLQVALVLAGRTARRMAVYRGNED
jgi:hypothetical protein